MASSPGDPLPPAAPTLLTVLTVFSALVATLIILVPAFTRERDLDAQGSEERLASSMRSSRVTLLLTPTVPDGKFSGSGWVNGDNVTRYAS